MPDPGFTRPDLCSIRAAHRALPARFRRDPCPAVRLRGACSADRPPSQRREWHNDRARSCLRRLPRACGKRHRPRHPPVHRGGRARRGGHRGVCLLLARLRGRPGPRRDRDHRRLVPATIDGLVYAQHGRAVRGPAPDTSTLPGPLAARAGIAATLTANMAQGWSHGPVGAVVAAWPAVSLVGSYELLVWLVRTSGALERQPSAEHRCDDAVCRSAARSALTIDGGQLSRNNRDLSARGRQSTIQSAGQAATTASAQHADGVPGAGPIMTQRWPRTGSA